MTREEIINGLKFTVEMFLFDPSTGETFTKPRNDMDKTTIDACRGAIELLEQEPSGDLISRQAVLDGIEELKRSPWCTDKRNGYEYLIAEALDVVKDLCIKQEPSVNPQPKTGHWSHDGSHWKNRFICSECGYKLFDEQTNYCPNCGARMVEPQESEVGNEKDTSIFN